MKKKTRIPIAGESITWTSPFAALRNMDLPSAPNITPCELAPAAPKKNRGRVDIIRHTAHRGGKTVTVVTGFTGIGPAEIERLARRCRRPVAPEARSKRGGSKFKATSASPLPVSWPTLVFGRCRLEDEGPPESEPLSPIDFLPCPLYRWHHYSDMAWIRFPHH